MKTGTTMALLLVIVGISTTNFPGMITRHQRLQSATDVTEEWWVHVLLSSKQRFHTIPANQDTHGEPMREGHPRYGTPHGMAHRTVGAS
jgi:hypothetical protein